MGKADTTLFVKHKNQDILIVQIYVDDIIFGSINELLCKEFSLCMSKEFEMSMMGELKYFLGLQIKQNEEEIFINQAKYVKDLLKRFTIDNLKTKSTLMSTTIKHDKDEKGNLIFSRGSNYEVTLTMKAEDTTVVGVQAALADIFFTVGKEPRTYKFETGFIAQDLPEEKQGISIGCAFPTRIKASS